MACGSERPVMVQQLERVVEHAPSRSPPAAMIGQELLDVVAEERRGEACSARACIQLMLPRRVLISPLWREEAEGLREIPGWQGVGAEALVDQRQRADQVADRDRSG